MTKKHYTAIAAILKIARANSNPNQHMMVDVILIDITDYFATDNPLFNRAKFLTACGIDQTS